MPGFPRRQILMWTKNNTILYRFLQYLCPFCSPDRPFQKTFHSLCQVSYLHMNALYIVKKPSIALCSLNILYFTRDKRKGFYRNFFQGCFYKVRYILTTITMRSIPPRICNRLKSPWMRYPYLYVVLFLFL